MSIGRDGGREIFHHPNLSRRRVINNGVFERQLTLRPVERHAAFVAVTAAAAAAAAVEAAVELRLRLLWVLGEFRLPLPLPLPQPLLEGSMKIFLSVVATSVGDAAVDAADEVTLLLVFRFLLVLRPLVFVLVKLVTILLLLIVKEQSDGGTVKAK